MPSAVSTSLGPSRTVVSVLDRAVLTYEVPV
jgi:hypothetical protein